MIGGNKRGKMGEKCALWTVKTHFEDREYKTLARLGNEVAAGIKSPYSCGFRDFEKALNVYSL